MIIIFLLEKSDLGQKANIQQLRHAGALNILIFFEKTLDKQND